MKIERLRSSITIIASFCLLLLLQSCGEHTPEEDIPSKPTSLAVTDNMALPHTLEYSAHIRPILENRCVVCHACYDAPCQLKLSSPEGIDRGANPIRVYDGERLTAMSPTRLFIDAQDTEQWRDKGFFSILDQHQDHLDQQQQGLLRQILLLKQANPLPLSQDGRLDDDVDFSANHNWYCPSPSDFSDYSKKHPHGGMPFGLPGLTQSEYDRLFQWLDAGAAMSSSPELSQDYLALIEQWETFLNQTSLRGQLVARYIYEHLFLAHIYFSNLEKAESAPNYFRLVRSSTPPGQPIKIIATRRPFDDPETKQVYYRLQRTGETVVTKTHLPYAFNADQKARWQTLFFDPEYTVTELPSYQPDSATNPFITFRELPIKSRYRFMLEQAQFTIRGFIRGSVCHGQVALNVIDDHFWVIFADPNTSPITNDPVFLNKQSELLGLPSTSPNDLEPLTDWLNYSHKQKTYLEEKTKLLNHYYSGQSPLDLSLVWNGGKQNKNAALTVFRHFDSASVVQGFQGGEPKTTWLIDYPILERIHYLLVAGFDVYGNAGHQLLTRLHMDFLRMESEANFLSLIPLHARPAILDYWYRGADQDVKDYLSGPHNKLTVEPSIHYESTHYQPELYHKLEHYLSPVLSLRHALQQKGVPAAHAKALESITQVKGQTAHLLPEMSLLMIDDQLYTVLRNSAHSNISGLFDEQSRRLPDEDSVSILTGVVGAYPDALWKVDSTELDAFVDVLESMQTQEDYRQFMQQFGVRRSSPSFWAHSDDIHRLLQQANPIEYGLLDYNRLENR